MDKFNGGDGGLRLAFLLFSEKCFTCSEAPYALVTLLLLPYPKQLSRRQKSKLGSPKILIVEDFDDLRNLVTFYLCARGYDILEAPNGKTAIETAVNGNPNLVLLDLRLPDINGLDVARELRKLPQAEHIPIVAWTADCGSKPREEEWRCAGIIDCLQKPVSMRELEAVVERFAPTRHA